MDRFAGRCFLSLVSYCVDTCAIGCSVNGQRHLFLEVLRDDCYGPFVTMPPQIVGPGKATAANRCSQEVFHCVEHRLANDSREQMLKAHSLWCAVDVLGIVQRHWTKVDQMIQHIWFWTFLMNPSIFTCNTKRVEAMICWLVSCRTFGIVGFIGSIFLGGHIRVYEDSRWGFWI